MLGRQLEMQIHQWISSGQWSAWRDNLYSVGGFVRDFLIQKQSLDVDLMVTIPGGAEKLASTFKAEFKNSITTPVQMGAMYPIWSFEFKEGPFQGLKVDIADSQKEMFPKNDSRERITSFGDFNQDIERRDFTINMLARNLTTDQIVDQSGCGLRDLQAKIIRSHPHVDAGKILSDDPLRIIRAVRFACTHDFKIEQSLFLKLKEFGERIKIVSHERILLELTKMTASGKFSYGLELFSELGLTKIVFGDAVEKMIADSSTKEQIFKILNSTEPRLVFQFAGLFYFLNQTEVESIFTKLKLSHHHKKEILQTIQTTEKILLLNPQDFVEVRHFLRQCDLNISELMTFAKAVSEDFNKDEFMATQKKCTAVPISKKAVLDGNEIADLLKISGPDIKKVQDFLFKIEDQYVFDHSLPIPKEAAQQFLLAKYKV